MHVGRWNVTPTLVEGMPVYLKSLLTVQSQNITRGKVQAQSMVKSPQSPAKLEQPFCSRLRPLTMSLQSAAAGHQVCLKHLVYLWGVASLQVAPYSRGVPLLQVSTPFSGSWIGSASTANSVLWPSVSCGGGWGAMNPEGPDTPALSPCRLTQPSGRIHSREWQPVSEPACFSSLLLMNPSPREH